jgi:hypothetical protein
MSLSRKFMNKLSVWISSNKEWFLSGMGVMIFGTLVPYIYKDIYLPLQRPSHLSIEASLKPVSDSPTAAAGLEMLLEIKATNVSSRRLFLLDNIWSLRSISAAPRTRAKVDREFIEESNEALKGYDLRHAERGVTRSTGKLIAIGRLFGDEFIDVGNSSIRTILVNIPIETKAVELSVIMPLLSKQPQPTLFTGQRLIYQADMDGDIRPLLCPRDSLSGNLGCREFEGNDDKALKQFDQQNFWVSFYRQFGVPTGMGN